MSWGKFALVELGMHVEPFVGGSNPPNSGKNMYMLIKTINLISIHWLLNDIKYYLMIILKNYDILCTLIIKLYKILFDNNIVICDYNMSNFKKYLILKNYDIL